MHNSGRLSQQHRPPLYTLRHNSSKYLPKELKRMSASTNILNITDDDDEVLSVIEEAEVLTQDFYGAARIPGIVVAMAILHFIGFLILAFYRKGKPTFPPKLNPLSAKDQERHFMAKMFLLPCSCLAWIIAVLATNSCKFVRVDEDTAFGMFRVQNPKTGFCESFPVDDPANALVAARVFAVITTVLLGVTFVMIGGLCSLPLFDEDFQKDYFPKQPVQYRLWMCVTVMQYLSIWTSIYQYFIFGLDFCKANDYEDNPLAPQCKLGPGGMSTLFNIAFLVLIWLVAVWYVWDALTPRPLTKEAKRQSNIAPDHDIAKQTSSRKRMSMATEDLTDSPRLQAHKNEVRKELMNKRRSPKGSKRKLGSVNSPNPSRQRASVPVMTRAPRPGAKRATSVPNMQKQPSARRPRDKRPLSMSPQPQRKPRVSATTDSHTEFTIGSKPRVVRVNSTKNNISQRNSRASPRPSSASPRRKPIEERKSNTAKTMPPMPNL